MKNGVKCGMILQKAISLKWLAKSIHGKGVSWLDILERWMLRSIALFLSFANTIQEGSATRSW
jgi:hypothetical protein